MSETNDLSALLAPFTESKGKAIHMAPKSVVVAGSIQTMKEEREVIVLAVSGKYAMVRRPRCMPYVAMTEDLFMR